MSDKVFPEEAVRAAVSKADTDDKTPMIYFFGCWGEPGHYYYTPGRRRAWNIGMGSPWGTYGEGIDGKLQPRFGDREAPQGVAALVKKEAQPGVVWTALSFWDRTGDRRGASNSNFLARGDFTADEMIALAREHFPEVMKRLDDAGIEIKVV